MQYVNFIEFNKNDYYILELLTQNNSAINEKINELDVYIKNKPHKFVLKKIKEYIIYSNGALYSSNKHLPNRTYHIMSKYNNLLKQITNHEYILLNKLNQLHKLKNQPRFQKKHKREPYTDAAVDTDAADTGTDADTDAADTGADADTYAQKKMIIPKKIFQTWKTKNVEGNHKMASDSWKVFNKKYKYELSDDYDSREFIKYNFPYNILESYDKLIPGALKADLWRYCKLYIEGGIYCDMDLVCLTKLEDSLFSNYDMVTVLDLNNSGGGIFQGFLAVTKKNIIIKKIIDECIKSINNERYYEECIVRQDNGELLCKGMLAVTGPLLFKKVLMNMNGNNAMIEGDNIIGNSKIRLLKYNENDTLTFGKRILFKHRYTNYKGSEELNYYSHLWGQENVYRTPIYNKLNEHQPIDINYYSNIKHIHYNTLIGDNFTIFTAINLYVIIKNNTSIKLYRLIDDSVTFIKNIDFPYKTDKLDFLLEYNNKYLFLNKYKGEYKVLYMDSQFNCIDTWDLDFLDNNIVVDDLVKNTSMNIISNSRIYNINMITKKYVSEPVNNMKFKNICCKIININNNKIALFNKTYNTYTFVKLNEKYEIMKKSCEFILDRKKIFNIDCFNDTIYLYTYNKNKQFIHFMETNVLGDFLDDSIVSRISTN
tara:strand:- start:17177 stop:19141 length:1965 start_codon:yes stop_codon:yes gene_type:complete